MDEVIRYINLDFMHDDLTFHFNFKFKAEARDNDRFAIIVGCFSRLLVLRTYPKMACFKLFAHPPVLSLEGVGATIEHLEVAALFKFLEMPVLEFGC